MERGGGKGDVIESFAFLENIIDRFELIGAETIGRRSRRARLLSLEFTAADAPWKNR